MTHRNGVTDTRIDSESLYWAVLAVPDSGVRGRRARQRMLDNLLDTELPLPIEQVQASYLHLGSSSVLVCAIERERLTTWLSHDLRSLRPRAIPEHLGVGDRVGPRWAMQLDLLHGDFEPPVNKRARRRRVKRATTCVVVAAGAFVVGAERMRADASRSIHRFEQQLADLANQLSPPAPAIPPAIRLAAEARRAQSMSDVSREISSPTDAWVMLRAVLAAWPEDSDAYLDAARADGTTVTLAISGPNAEEIGHLVRDITDSTTLRADQPTIASHSGGSRASFSLSAAIQDRTGGAQ